MEKNKEKVSIRMWLIAILIGLAGQFAWSIENMYLNKFIFSFGSENYTTMITLTVALSAITACLTTIFMGALSDKLNKRKIFISIGYILWGIATASFGLINVNNVAAIFPLASAATVSSILVIVLDCIMTFFGSTANDAAFNSYITRNISSKNRGKVEGVLSILPLISMLIIFGGLNFLTTEGKWDIFFYIIGAFVFVIGIISLFLLPKEQEIKKENDKNEKYLSILIEGFKIKTIKKNLDLYLILIAFLIYGIATQVFFPYLMIYFEFSLNIHDFDFVLALGIILIIGSLLSVVFGIIMDKLGKNKMLIPSIIIGFIGFLLIFFVKENQLIFAIIAGIIMMFGYIFISAVLNSKVRDLVPTNKEGVFMGVRMIFVVMLPMCTGPYIGQFLTDNFSTGKYESEFGELQNLPPASIWLVAALILLLALIPLIIYLIRQKKNKNNNLKENKNEGLIIPLKEEDKINDINYIPLNIYPNPSFKRDNYQILNGWWDFKISKEENLPISYEEKILVPYSIESPLSHINKLCEIDDILFYHKKVILDKSFILNKLYLNCLGIDQYSEIYINNILVHKSNSGYLPIKVDISPLIRPNDLTFDIVIKVKDQTDNSYFTRGKQSSKRGKIWYTSTSGIYKTIYFESTYRDYIEDFKIDYDIDREEIYLEVKTNNRSLNEIGYISFNEERLEFITNKVNTLKLNDFRLWDTLDPYLYNIKIEYLNDVVYSYLGIRKIELKKNQKGILRLYLNNKEIILKGVLDQGYYYKGNLTPASYDAYLQDIQNLKKLGFNTIRKHIKYEDDYFYYLCDKKGMLVVQDFVNGGNKYDFLTISLPALFPYRKKNVDKNYSKFKRDDKEGRIAFEKELLYWLNAYKNHPSIIIWTIFNEGWGQFDSSYFYDLVKIKDPTRLIDLTSGWYDNKKSDFYSKHIYFTKVKDYSKKNRAYFLSECGGFSLYLKDHFYGNLAFGYKNFKDKNKLSKKYQKFFEKEVIPTLKRHNIGFIFTQLSDVEDEVNGLYTFDREILKFDEKIVQNINHSIDELI